MGTFWAHTGLGLSESNHKSDKVQGVNISDTKQFKGADKAKLTTPLPLSFEQFPDTAKLTSYSASFVL